MNVLVVCGLASEARIVAGRGVVTVAGPNPALRAALDRVAPGTLRAVVSFGIAGGLSPAVRSGTLLVPDSVAGARVWRTDPALVATALAALGDVPATHGAVAGVDVAVLTPTGKRALRAATGAAAVDTESHLAAAFAARHGLPLLVLRAVADGAECALPPLALVAIGADGRVAPAAIARELLAHPGQFGRLPATALAAARAMRTLRRAWAILGPVLAATPR